MRTGALMPSDTVAVLDVLGPGEKDVQDHATAWVAARDFDNFFAVVMLGTLGADATVDAKLEQATDATGAGAKDVPGAAITQLVKATDDDTQAVVQCAAESLDFSENYRFLRLTVTVGTAACRLSAVLHGQNARYGPAADYNVASVAEVVRVTGAGVAVAEEEIPTPPPAPDAVISAVAADGWQATWASGTPSVPATVDVTREGYDGTGTATTFTETLTLGTRVREPYPDQATLTADTVALADYIYSGDVIAGVTNNSTVVSPKPVANWATLDRKIIGDTLTAEVVVAER